MHTYITYVCMHAKVHVYIVYIPTDMCMHIYIYIYICHDIHTVSAAQAETHLTRPFLSALNIASCVLEELDRPGRAAVSPKRRALCILMLGDEESCQLRAFLTYRHECIEYPT